MNERDYFKTMRQTMIETQIIQRQVTDTTVLRAMQKVPRHLFVPGDMQRFAYQDEPLPIGAGQTISQPYIVAFMTEQLNLKTDERVLEIGTGSGYQAAVLAEIVDTVYTIEIIPELGRQAAKTLQTLGYHNVICKIGDGYAGWTEHAPFDAIIITAAPPRMPEKLISQLKDGGRMILPLGGWKQKLILITKSGETIERKVLLPVRFVPMTGEIQKMKDPEK